MEVTQFSKEYFFQLLFSEQEMEKVDVLVFEKWVNSFIFFPLASMALCKKYQQIQSSRFQKQLKYVASIVPSRSVFQHYMKGELKIKNHIIVTEIQKNKTNITPIDFIFEPLPIKREVRTGHYDIENLYPEEKSRETLDDWLNNLKKNRQNQVTVQNKRKLNVSQVVQPKKVSVLEEEELVSETLAKIYETQENWEKAKQAYQLLIKKFPENKEMYLEKIQEINK
jgi:hypothetical protein